MDIDRPKKASLIKVRFVIVVLATLCPVVCYIARQNLALAIVAMVKDEDHKHPGSSSGNATGSAAAEPDLVDITQQCASRPDAGADGQLHLAPTSVTYGPKYEWSQTERGLVLGVFFYTYVIFQIPAARFAEIIGAKWILALAGIGSCALSLLSPLAASFNVYLFALVRVLMGVCQTALYPAGYVLYSQWLPPTERSLALPILMVGAYLGSIITSTATGFFSEKESFGWPYAFYMPGLLCGCWSILWLMFATSEPREHRYISLEELEYIELRTGMGRAVAQASAAIGEKTTTKRKPKKSPSWAKIIKSQHVWAMVAAFFASNWAFTITMLLLPSYLNHILLIPPFRNGLINSLLYVLFCVSSPIMGAMATLMVETRPFRMSHLQVRKFFQCTAVFSQAICFLLLPAIGCNTDLALYLCYVQIILFSFVNGGEVQLPSDLSVDFAGTIYAIGNCFGSSTGFLVPMVHALIVDDNKNREQWNRYFYVAASITSLGGLIFLVFGRNDLQDFAKHGQDGDVEGDDSIEKEQDICGSPKGDTSIKLDAHKEKPIQITI